jgi:formylglycine-generating enzyme required for sulfatase activity
LGLYDMHGNVWEWCDDADRDGDNLVRVHRGGGWSTTRCRTADRSKIRPWHRTNYTGLRLARGPVRPVPKSFTNSLGMEFMLVPKGKSWLGGGGGKPGSNEVDMPYDFYLGKYEVTQEEWRLVMGNNPSAFANVAGVSKDELVRFPVESVSWEDAQKFLTKLNALDQQAGWVYRLPKEVEWEYACRGGPLNDKAQSAYDFYFANPSRELLPEQANFEHGKGLKRTCKVGSYQPNRLGLHDMHGNVWEWCDDEWKDHKGASRRVNRGGAWSSVPDTCRAAFRGAGPPSYRNGDVGLRVARVPTGAGVK